VATDAVSKFNTGRLPWQLAGNQSTFGEVMGQLEGCIDDERQFKTAKRLVTPLF